ncbi:MAG: hypothetical protein M3Q65_04810 [Chloroflexota bacterium]|nr:hypothetical protein [Chloroflexota bacterium]
MDRPDREAASQQLHPAAGTPPPVRPLLDDRESVAPASEFLCPGCGRPLAVTLRSDMCFAEAQVYCPDCERDFQERRGRWAE